MRNRAYPAKPVVWLGSTYADLIGWQPEVRRDAGYQLWKVQRGEAPSDWKPMTVVGSGVREIRIHERPGEFRVIYLAARSEAVYVLHCFRKQSAKTEAHDIEIATKRFKAIAR